VRRSVDITPRFARALLVAVVVLITLIFVAGDVGLWKLWTAQKQTKTLQAKIAGLEKENALLGSEIELLRGDSFTIEKVAREKYGYLKPGDKVYRILTPSDSPDQSKAARSIDRGPGKQ
jgi:cell division protein FtsB